MKPAVVKEDRQEAARDLGNADVRGDGGEECLALLALEPGVREDLSELGSRVVRRPERFERRELARPGSFATAKNAST